MTSNCLSIAEQTTTKFYLFVNSRPQLSCYHRYTGTDHSILYNKNLPKLFMESIEMHTCLQIRNLPIPIGAYSIFSSISLVLEFTGWRKHNIGLIKTVFLSVLGNLQHIWPNIRFLKFPVFHTSATMQNAAEISSTNFQVTSFLTKTSLAYEERFTFKFRSNISSSSIYMSGMYFPFCENLENYWTFVIKLWIIISVGQKLILSFHSQLVHICNHIKLAKPGKQVVHIPQKRVDFPWNGVAIKWDWVCENVKCQSRSPVGDRSVRGFFISTALYNIREEINPICG
jgi:hypothetical protein